MRSSHKPSQKKNFIATHPIAELNFRVRLHIRLCFKGKQILFVRWSEPLSNYRKKSIGSFKAIGMRIRYMEPKSHDKHIAHRICLIYAFMLGKVINKERHEQDIFDMAGVDLSTVRLAKVHQLCGRPF
jgi:prephenate dehydrogenase